jgi:hypothetical protein
MELRAGLLDLGLTMTDVHARTVLSQKIDEYSARMG